LDGAYGLTEDSHGMFLCQRKKHKKIRPHLIKFHKLTISSADKICRAIQNKKDPRKVTLFQSNDIVIDQINQFQCPLSKYNHQSTINDPSEHRCRTVKPQIISLVRYHLVRDHRMSISKANKLVDNLKVNSKQ